MKFEPTKFDAAWLLKIEPQSDNRGFFARTWCTEEFRKQGLADHFVQCNVSFNQHEGTVRGMHFQVAPSEECKIVRCTHGAIFDVIVDCRLDSPTLGMWEGFFLNDDNHDSLYIPEGFAHGFQTLAARTEVLYQMNEFYHPQCARGFHYLDQDIGINWPKPILVVSEKDRRSGPFSSCLADLREH
ncbi:dTDP-4-dehydrorhamnose 3,5-epimerase [Neorhodopirellula pilleata]|uniref:dTDP-4-dehydrorhamnose 3,5-epimerase n=1 Tax=Neorhodopirellula pilleata TaxID=2714738 RepID=A0A5C6A8A4_9BACT|nr:dTDP-4-dehydrorhamnose 3,5-epimerase [Neorhodopirellula pilleata]TWT95617.1 dTDP-4-dehydrorhamnose 3,5-epimerase [Neorhodopirellula pilleata]